jgi:DNA polymerase III delta prime subunit
MSELWVEKYRPRNLEDVVIDQGALSILKSFVENKSIPHLLFSGSAGLGKTTCAKILAQAITDPSDRLYINASDEASIEVIRGKVKTFCATASFGGIKVVTLDEFDGMSANAMMMLRNTMEEFSNHCRFILTCNHPERVIDPIKSRCQVFDFTGTEKKSIADKCVKILKSENVDFLEEKENIKVIINKFYPDIRKIINTLQQFSSSGKLQYHENKSDSTEVQDLLIQYVKEKDVKKIVKELLGSGTDYQPLFRVLFDKVDEFGITDVVQKIHVLTLIADRMHRHAISIDPEINFRDLINNLCLLI